MCGGPKKERGEGDKQGKYAWKHSYEIIAHKTKQTEKNKLKTIHSYAIYMTQNNKRKQLRVQYKLRRVGKDTQNNALCKYCHYSLKGNSL